MRISALPCLDQFSSGVNVGEIESTTSSAKGVINSERTFGILTLKVFMVLFYISGDWSKQARDANHNHVFHDQSYQSFNGCYFCFNCQSPETSYGQAGLVVNSLKHFRDGKHLFIIYHEFADLNSCCIFILVCDQPCIALHLLIFCQVAIMGELLVQNALTLCFKGELKK